MTKLVQALKRLRSFLLLPPIIITNLSLKIPVFLFAINASLHLSAQETPLKYRIHYKQEEKTFYAISDTSIKFTGPEMVKLRNQTVTDSIVKDVDLNNDIMTTIFHLENTGREEWMVSPVKTVIDKNNTILYGEKGEILLSSPHSDEYVKNYESVRAELSSDDEDIIPDFYYMNDEAIHLFIDNGFTYTDLGKDGYQFTKDTIEITVNDDHLSRHVVVYSATGAILSDQKNVFTKNNSGQIVPDYTIFKSPDDRFKNNCVQKIQVTNYSDYTITYFEDERQHDNSAVAGCNEELIIYPNPVQDFMKIYFDRDSFASATLEIMDESGNILVTRYFSQMQKDIIVPVADLSAGIYIVRIFDPQQEIHKTFIKN